MAFQLCDLPASSQLSSILSDPPHSDEETLGEITVDLNTTSMSPSQNSNTQDTKHTTNMPSRISKSVTQTTRQSQRQSKRKPLYKADSSEDELGGEIQVSPSISRSRIPAKRNRSDSAAKPAPKPAAKKIKPVNRGVKKWEPEFVTQNAKSPLVTHGVDLRTLLLQPAAWSVLSADDKKEILSFFPADVHILDPNTPDARPNVGSLSSNDTFRHDAEEYVSNMGRGMHDPEWLQQAWAAHQRRATGAFDEFYIRKVEVDWSTDIPDDHRPEHLRIVKSGRPSSSDGQVETGRNGRPMSGRSEDKFEKNGMSGGGTSERSVIAEDSAAKSTNGTKAPTPDRKVPNGTSGVANGITARFEAPPKSNDGPRFEVIPTPDESEAENDPDHKGSVNGAVNGVSQEITVGDAVDGGGDASQIMASTDEITVAADGMVVDGAKADGLR